MSIKQDRDIYCRYNYTSETVTNGNPPTPGAGNGTTLLIPVKNILVALNADAGLAFGRSKIELAYYLPVELSSSDARSFKMGMIGLSYFIAILK